MSANVWNPGSDIVSVNANTTLVKQSFSAAENQTVFNLTLFSYAPNTGSLIVFRNGQLLNNISETSPTSFTLTNIILNDGDLITAIGFVGITATVPAFGNASTILCNTGKPNAVNTNLQTDLSLEVYPEKYGAVGDGVHNDLPAILAAIASFPYNQDDTYYSFAGTLKLQPGKNYYCAGALNIERQLKIIGATSPDGNALGASRLSFADNCDGIVIHDYRTSASGKDAGGTEIEGVCIQRTGNTGGTVGNGVWMRTRARLKNCIVYNFRQNGIHIEATSGGSPQGNANNWKIDGVRSMGNGLHGLFVDGADVNAGVATRLDCSSNGGWGIYDSSFLGNTYVGCHTASNTLGAYKADGLNAQNVFLGCYSEGGQPASDANATSLFIGGSHGAGFTTTTTSWILGGGFGVRSGNLNAYSNDGNSSINIGSGNTNEEWLQLSRSGSAVWRGKSLPGRLYLDWANLAGTEFLSIYDRNVCTIANGYPRDQSNMGAWEAPKLGLPLGYFGAGMLARIEGTAAPTAGAWLKGDIVWNTNPASAGYIGWVCTVAGSPGTWKTFGQIS